MNPHPVLETFINWLLNHSLQAGELVLMVLLLQFLLRRWLTARWRFALWWIVMARLVLPFSPQSVLSVFNYVRPLVAVEGPRYYVPPPTGRKPAVAVAERSNRRPATSDREFSTEEARPGTIAQHQPKVRPASAESGSVAPAPPVSPARIPAHALSFDDLLIPGLTALWFIGAVGLALGVLVPLHRFKRKLGRSGAPANPAAQDLFNVCQREFGVTREIALLETDAVNSPALFGLIHLRLLLPKGFATRFTSEEQRYIFLHELAHVKRHDLWLNWLVTGLQIMHWFNPLIWLGFARLRADRELACDELALLHAGEKVGKRYGETIIKLLEGLSRPAAIPGLVGILEDTQQMRRRILRIARFRKPGRWSALAVLLLGGVATAALTDARTGRPDAHPASGLAAASSVPAVRSDLTGQVHNRAGSPLAATVFISTASPKVGTSTFCPSCYPDCGKSARTDAAGNFKITSLSPQLRFRILAVAKGYKPKFVSRVDPARGPVRIRLSPIESNDATPDRSLRGRVVDTNGTPIEGAVVEMQGVETRGGRGSWGRLPGIDPLAVTDTNGDFLITAKKPFELMDVAVKARGYADKNFRRLPSGAVRHSLVMTEGAMLTGRVLFQGKPLSGVSVGVSGVDRTAGNYLGNFEVGTDTNGDFSFFNLPPDASYYIYGLMGTLRQFGAIPIQTVHSAKDGGKTDVRDLIVGPAHRLAGRVVLADGRPVPPNTRLLIGRESAWDSLRLMLGKDGSFDTAGIPSGEAISLSVRVAGYHLSGRNASLDTMDPLRLVGRVDRDITNLVVLLERGKTPRPNFSAPIIESTLPQNLPLGGAKAAADHSMEWIISGRVLDRRTEQPLARFTVTPGLSRSFGGMYWDSLHAVEGTNGAYRAYVNKHFAHPLLKVEAAGYLPASTTLLAQNATQVDFLLKRGSGPSGTVVSADRKAAPGATLVLLSDGLNPASLSGDGRLTTYWNRAIEQKTDANGRFSFKPELGMKAVAAASSNGFAIVDLNTLATNPVIVLQPFGRINGRLERTSGPGTNEDLDVAFADANLRAPLPRISLGIHAVTDARGRFTFDHVPPGHLQISYRESIPGQPHGWRNIPLKQVLLRPGQTLKVNIATADRPKPQNFVSSQPPGAIRIPGQEVKGRVLAPDGKPAAGAEVALQVPGKYLALGPGTFVSSGSREEGLVVNSGPDGRFTLPMYQDAEGVVALNTAGFAKVRLQDLQASPQIRLQRWGTIEGKLRIDHHAGSNTVVVVESDNSTIVVDSDDYEPAPLFYDLNTFQARTDAGGRFIFNFVPPGRRTLARLVPFRAGSWMNRRIGTVDVKPGQITRVTFRENGRTVIGRVVLPTSAAGLDLRRAGAFLRAPMPEILNRLWRLKTPAERKALRESKQFQAAIKTQENSLSLPLSITPKGSFRVEDVPPGTYEMNLQYGNPAALVPAGDGGASLKFFNSISRIVVPPFKGSNDIAPVNVGNVRLSYSGSGGTVMTRGTNVLHGRHETRYVIHNTSAPKPPAAAAPPGNK